MQLRSGLFIAYVACALLGIFWLPLHVPVPASGSISYMFGFSNRTSLLALLLALAVGGLALRSPAFGSLPSTTCARVSHQTLLLALLLTALLCAFMTLVASPTWGMDESPYLLGRIQLVLAGQHPYRNFEYIYGPALLYLPAFAARVLHLDVGPAYFLIWSLEWLVGVVMMAIIIGWLGFPPARVRLAFWLLWSIFLSSLVNTGETYAPLRELAALFAILTVHQVLTRRGLGLALALAVLLGAILLTISPEFSIAFMLATAIYLPLSLADATTPVPWRALLPGYLATLSGFGLLLWLAARLHEFDSARQFRSGGSDIPLLLTPTILFVLTGFLVAVAAAVSLLRRRALRDPRIPAAILGLLLVPGMMARADPSHLILYGLSLLLVALITLAARSETTWRRSTLLAFLLLSASLLEKKLLIDFLPFFDAADRLLFPTGAPVPGTSGARLAAAVRSRFGPVAEQNLLRELHRQNPDPHASYPSASPTLYAPFGYVVRGSGKQIRPDVVLGYFDGTTDLMSDVQVERKTAEIAAHPERDLLLPAGFTAANGCREDPQWAADLLRLNFGLSYLHQERNTPHLLDSLCRFIGDHYERAGTPSADNSLYDLWRRR